MVCVPELARNLISVAKILYHRGSEAFSQTSGKIMHEKRILAYADYDRKDNQFIVKCVPAKTMS